MSVSINKIELIVQLARETVPLSPGSNSQLAAESAITETGSRLNPEERRLLIHLISHMALAALSTDYSDKLEQTITTILAEQNANKKRLTLLKLLQTGEV